MSTQFCPKDPAPSRAKDQALAGIASSSLEGTRLPQISAVTTVDSILAKARAALCARPGRQARRWFAEADNFTANCAFGYASVTGPIPLSEWQRLLPGASALQLRALMLKAEELYRQLPAETDFLKRKAQVVAAARPYLRMLAGKGRLLQFGSPVGDIDLACIDTRMADENHRKKFETDCIACIRAEKLYRRFPLFDWESLIYFACPSVSEFQRRIRFSRAISSGLNESELPAAELAYIERTMRTVKDLL